MAVEVLLELAGVAYGYDLEAGILVHAEEQDASAWAVGEDQTDIQAGTQPKYL